MPSAFDPLRVQFERLRASRFSSLKAADARLGGTLVLFGVTLGAGVMLALTPPSDQRKTGVEAASVDRWVGRQAEKPAGSVKIVDAAPRREIPCAEQTWPYIDRRCLTIAGPKPAKPQAETTGAGSSEMTPVTATIAASKPPREAREQSPVAAPSDGPERDSMRAHVAGPQPRPQIEAALKPAAPEKLNVKPEAASTDVVHQQERPALAATPASVTTPGLATQQPEKRVLKLTDKVGPAIALAVAPAKRAQRTAQSNRIDAKPRIVSRWTEKVYDLGDGRTHRVITVRQGSGPAGYGGARRALSYAADDDD